MECCKPAKSKSEEKHSSQKQQHEVNSLSNSDSKIILYNTILLNIFSEEHPKSRSKEGIYLMHSKDRLVQLQIKCMKAYVMNEVIKRKIMLEKQNFCYKLFYLKKKNYLYIFIFNIILNLIINVTYHILNV